MNPAVPPLVPTGATFAFGKSPFHVKGVLYAGTQSYFEKRVPGRMATLLAEIGPSPLRDFIAQRFLVSSRYDVMPVPALIAHEGRAMGTDRLDLMRPRRAAQRAASRARPRCSATRPRTVSATRGSSGPCAKTSRPSTRPTSIVSTSRPTPRRTTST